MLAGASRVHISPPLPMDVVGYVRRAVAPRAFAEPLLATCWVLRDGGTTVAIIGADLVGMPPQFATASGAPWRTRLAPRWTACSPAVEQQ